MADLIDRDAALARIDCCLGNSLGGRKEFDSGLMQARKFVISTPAANLWIPVEDALPDAFICVICAGEEGMAILRYNGKVWVDDAGCIYPMSAITHWMLLPEPPKGEQK